LNDAIRDPKNPPTFLPSRDAFRNSWGSSASRTRRVSSRATIEAVFTQRVSGGSELFGHPNVALLDGGWTKWQSEKRPIATSAAVPQATLRRHQSPLAGDRRRRARGDWKKGVKIVMRARRRNRRQGASRHSARRRDSFVGARMRGYAGFQTRALKPAANSPPVPGEVVPTDEVIVYCQVGMRASHDLFVLHLLGYERLRNYYGAWEEWGNRDDLPIVTKAPPK
jgi:thiosulfate/3-mercaptopyruvate sulfurtransferase